MRKNGVYDKSGWKKYKYGNTFYRSTWEMVVAKFLDKFEIEYVYEKYDEATKTRPDFYFPELDLYLEVHPDCWGVKKNLPENCILVKTKKHAEMAAIIFSRKHKRKTVNKYFRCLDRETLKEKLSQMLDLATYMKQLLTEQEMESKIKTIRNTPVKKKKENFWPF